MKQQKVREKGFTAVEGIAAVIVVLLLVFGTWWVWQKNGDDQNKRSANMAQNETDESAGGEDNKTSKSKTFNCKDIFTVVYPDSLQAAITDVEQCLISNISTEEMPPVGPLPPEQLGLFFNTEPTELASSKAYLESYIERSQQDYKLELKNQEEVKLDNGGVATLATIYGGHPVQHDFYFFIYIKDGKAIATSYPVNSSHKSTALDVLKSIK